MARIRIGLVTSCIDHRSARGTALVARRFLERLSSHTDEFEFTFIHASRTNDPIYQSYKEFVYPAIPFPFGRTMLNEACFWVRHWLTCPAFDVVHYLQPRVWPSYLCSHARRIIVTPHDAGIMLNLHPMGLGEHVFRFTNRFLHQRMHRLIAVSEFSRQEIARFFHIAPERIVTAVNGVDLDYRPPSDRGAAKERLRKRYQIPEKYILSVGRLDPHKNIIRLIESYHLLRQQGYEQHLVLVGGKHLPEYSHQVEEKIRGYHLEAYVHLAPYIEEVDMPLLYGMAEVLVYPSLHEGFGLPIIEAMKCGTPVATSRMTALPETAGGAAALFDPEDVEDIARVVGSVLADQEVRKTLVEAGLKRAAQFSWDRFVQALIGVYREMCRTRVT